MSVLDNQPPTSRIPREPASESDANGISPPLARRQQALGDSDDDRPVGNISVIAIPRREIARLSGTLRLSELPRHRPTIVFDGSRPIADPEDE